MRATGSICALSVAPRNGERSAANGAHFRDGCARETCSLGNHGSPWLTGGGLAAMHQHKDCACKCPSRGMEAEASAARSGPFLPLSVENAHARFDSSCNGNSRMGGIACDAIASRRGRTGYSSKATAHAMFVRFCGAASVRVLRADAAIASHRGWSSKSKKDTDQGVFARCCWLIRLLRLLAAADIAFRNGKSK